MSGTRRPPRAEKMHFAVVGAGVAGLACAQSLLARGLRATVFERNAQTGGRLGSLQGETGTGDFGAQYLTVQSETFADEVRRWVSADLLRSWDAVLVDMSGGQMGRLSSSSIRFVGIPAMQSLAPYLARGLDVVTNAEVGRIERINAHWNLFDGQSRPLGISGYDGLVLAMPSTEVLHLARGKAEFAARLEPLRWDACWSASLALSRPSGIEFDGAFINDDPILSWAARENSKPMRVTGEGVAERWQLQARASWSNSFMALAPDEAARWMQRAFAARLARPLAQKSCFAHCWKLATPADLLGEAFLWEPALGIGAAGDWCGGARIEMAYLSGLGLAQAIAG